MSQTPAPFDRPTPDSTPPEWTLNPQWRREIDGMGTMYTIAALASALGRSPISIRKWEDEGLFPRTPWIGLRGLRLYPYEVIAALVLLGEKAKVVGTSRTPSDSLEWFGRAAHALFERFKDEAPPS